MPMLKLVNVTFLLVVHLKRCLSAVLERPVQKYFSGLKPTVLTKKAFSYLHSNIHTSIKMTLITSKWTQFRLCHLTYQPHPLNKNQGLSTPGSPPQTFFSPIQCCNNKSGTWSSPGGRGKDSKNEYEIRFGYLKGNCLTHKFAAGINILLNASTWSGGGLLLTEVSIHLLTHVVGPPPFLCQPLWSLLLQWIHSYWTVVSVTFPLMRTQSSWKLMAWDGSSLCQ